MAPAAFPSRYLRCKVALGIFNTEFYVMISDTIAAYVDRSFVRVARAPENNDELDGEVLAYVVKEENDTALVEVSGEPVIGGLRNWVPKSALLAV